jgi:hypothetical protein
VTLRRHTSTREHDFRMHLGVVLMALQMLSRPPTTPLTPDQKELTDIIRRAAKAMEAMLVKPGSGAKR